MKETKQYVIRTQSNFANQYGVGEVVCNNCAFFREGFYNLTFDELKEALKRVGKAQLHQGDSE